MTGPPLSTLLVFGVRGRTGVLSELSSPLPQGQEASVIQVLDGGDTGRGGE